jgi:hypothetical protein
MGKHGGHDPPGGVTGLPHIVLVEVSVPHDRDGRSFAMRIVGNRGAARRRVIAALALVVVISTAGAVWLTNRDTRQSSVNVVAREPRPTQVPAAYGHAPSCLSFTILTSDRTYTRTDSSHRTRCGSYTAYPTAIIQYVSGEWRPVLDAIAYVCPMASLPAGARTQLDVCLPTHADRRALDR